MKSSLISVDADISVKLGLWKPSKPDYDWKDGKHGKDKDHDRDHGKDKDYDRDHGKHARKDDDCDHRSKGHDDDDCDLQAVLCSLPDVGSVLDCAISHLDCGSDCYDAPCDTDMA